MSLIIVKKKNKGFKHRLCRNIKKFGIPIRNSYPYYLIKWRRREKTLVHGGRLFNITAQEWALNREKVLIRTWALIRCIFRSFSLHEFRFANKQDKEAVLASHVRRNKIRPCNPHFESLSYASQIGQLSLLSFLGLAWRVVSFSILDAHG